MLPAASLSNVGIYGTGQAFEALLLRMRAHPLPEARALRRPDARTSCARSSRASCAGSTSPIAAAAGATTSRPPASDTAELVDVAVRRRRRSTSRRRCTLVDWDPDAEDKLLAAICYPHTDLPSQLLDRVRTLGADERLALVRAYVGERENRRHKPGRAFERVDYRFDVLCDYGAFRDLQRHRLLTIEWQPLTPNHGYVRPELVDEAGMADVFDDAMAPLGGALRPRSRDELPGTGRLRRVDGLPAALRRCSSTPARRSTCWSCARAPQGHPAYRRVALEMHRLIAEQAGHRAVAEAMTHLTTEAPELERLDAERRAEARRVLIGDGCERRSRCDRCHRGSLGPSEFSACKLRRDGCEG